MFCLDIFFPTSWILLKQLFLEPEWPLSQQPIRARGIIVKYSVGDRSLRPPRLTLDPEKRKPLLTLFRVYSSRRESLTTLTPFFLARSSNLLPFFFSSCLFIFLPNVSYICICQQTRVYHCMNRCVTTIFSAMR